MRCKHDNVLLSEETVTMLEFVIARGEIVSDSANNAGPTGYFTAQCIDCGYSRRFHSNTTFGLPQWMHAAYDAWKKLG
jgi:hypothetical protein